MLVAFSVVGTLVLNTTYVSQYSMIEGTLLQLIKFISLIKELDEINGGTGIAFGIIFLIFINFILMPYFYSIIIVVYNSMRETMSITTEAITAIESDRQLEFMKKIYALVTFASPQAMQSQKLKEEEKKKKEKNKDMLSESGSIHNKFNYQSNNARTPDKKNKTIIGGSQIDNNSVIRSTLNSPVRGRGGGETPLSGDRTRKNMTMIQQRQSLRASQLFDTENNNSFVRKASRMQTLVGQRKQGQGYSSIEERQMIEGAGTKMKWKQKLLYNFKQLGLNLYGLIPTKVEVQTRQERQDEILNRIELLNKEKFDLRQNIIKQRAKTARNNIKLTVVHIIFLTILIKMGTGQLMYEECYAINKSLENYYENTEVNVLYGLNKVSLKLKTISEINHVYSWIEQVFIPPLTLLYTQNQYTDRIDQYNLIFAKFPARITIRRSAMYENNAFSSYNSTSDKMETLKLFIQEAGDMSASSSYSSEFKQDFYGPMTSTEYYYINSGTSTTPFKKGGYVQYFTTQLPQNLLKLQYLQIDQIINHDTGVVILESIFYNQFYNLYSYVKITFEINSSGYIEKLVDISTFAIDLYDSERLIRLIWEILFFLEFLAYFFQFKRDFHEIFIQDDVKEITPYDPELEGNYILYMLNYKIEEGEYSVIGLFKQILTRIFEFTHRYLETLKVYCSKTTANVFLIVGQIIAFIMIIFYLSYITNSDRLNFDRNDSESYKVVGQFSDFSSQINQYSNLMSVLMFVQFMRILFYFGFSGKLALVLDVIANAKFDVIFFLIMFFILLSAFALISIVLFGNNISQFQNFPNAVIILLSWLSGVNDFPSKSEIPNTREYIYYLLFLIIMQLILTSMFIAILDGYFIQKISDKNDVSILKFNKIYECFYKQTKGIIDLILDILKAQYQQIRNNSKEKENENEFGTSKKENKESTENSKCLCLIKLRDKLWRYFNKLLLFFLQIYFSDEETEEMEKLIGQSKEEEGLKLNINFNETEDSSQNNSTENIDPRQEDLNYYWNKKQNKAQETSKSILEKKDKSSINFWMMLLTQSLENASNKLIDFTTYDQKGNTLYLNQQLQIRNYNEEQHEVATMTQIPYPQAPPTDSAPNQQDDIKIIRISLNNNMKSTSKNQMSKQVFDQYEPPLIQIGNKQMKKDQKKIQKRQRNIHIEYNQDWRHLFDMSIINEVAQSISQKIFVYDTKNKKQKLSREDILGIIDNKQFKTLLSAIYRQVEILVNQKSKKKFEYRQLSHLIYVFLYFYYNLNCLEIPQESKNENFLNLIENENLFVDEKEIQDGQLNLSQREISAYLVENGAQDEDNEIQSPQKPSYKNLSLQNIQLPSPEKSRVKQQSISPVKRRGAQEVLNEQQNEKKSGLPFKLHKNLSEAELLNTFQKCSEIKKLWRNTSLHDKIILWFGSDYNSPYLPHYLKSVLWYQMFKKMILLFYQTSLSINRNSFGYQKETFIPFQKKTGIDIESILDREVTKQQMIQLWSFLGKIFIVINEISDIQEKQINLLFQKFKTESYVIPEDDDDDIEQKKEFKFKDKRFGIDKKSKQIDQSEQKFLFARKNQMKPLVELKKKLQLEENGDLNTYQVNQVKDLHLKFIQCALRDETDRVGILYSKDTFIEKYLYLKQCKKIKHDHKMIIFHLMTLEEKMRLNFINQDELLSKIDVFLNVIIIFQTSKKNFQQKFLMIIEESYESIMSIIKLDKDLNREMSQWLFDFYYSYAQYNSYFTAFKVKKQFQAYTEKSDDVFEYVKDLEKIICRLDELIKDNIKILKQYIK